MTRNRASLNPLRTFLVSSGEALFDTTNLEMRIGLRQRRRDAPFKSAARLNVGMAIVTSG